MPSDIEKQWMAAWRYAGPELERVRERELRELSDADGLRMLGANSKTETIPGILSFQIWMMKLRIKQLTEAQSHD